MSGDCRKEIVRHVSEEGRDRLLAETDDEKVSTRLTFVRRPTKERRVRTQLLMSASPPQQGVDGRAAGMKGDSDNSYRTSGVDGPRSSMTTDKNVSLPSSKRDNRGKYRKFTTCSTKSSTLNTIQITSVIFPKSWLIRRETTAKTAGPSEQPRRTPRRTRRRGRRAISQQTSGRQ